MGRQAVLSATSLLTAGAVAVGCAAFPHAGEVSRDVARTAVPLEIGCEAEPSDPISLRGAELRGSALLLDITHAGGCAEHAYRVCGALEVLRTDPGQWLLTVLHDARGDSCEARIHRVLEVALDRHEPVDVSTLHERSVTVLVH